MFGLAMGVSRVSTTLPSPVYALLSGLNAATVGVIALAGVQLARKAITGPLTRLLVVGTGCAGICYNALWYFPVILIMDGMITLSSALWSTSAMRMNIIERRRRRSRRGAVVANVAGPEDSVQESAKTPAAGNASAVLQGVNNRGDGTSPDGNALPETPSSIPMEPSHGTTIRRSDTGGHSPDARGSPQSPRLQVLSIKSSIALAAAFLGE